MFRKMAHIWIASLVVGAVAGILTFLLAPEVGGAWWPYIRVIVALVVGFIATKITAVVGASIVSYRTAQSLFSNGGEEDSIWTEDDVSEFMDSFDASDIDPHKGEDGGTFVIEATEGRVDDSDNE
jgi:hypothetical protein